MAALPARAVAPGGGELVDVGTTRSATHDGDDEDDFDDLPQTHLDDEAYEEFLKRELDGSGRQRSLPPVAIVILVLVVLVLAIAVVSLRYK